MKGTGASLGAGSGIVIMPVRVTSYFKAESESSGFMGTGSSNLDERQVVRNVRGEVESDGKPGLQASGDIILQAARITAGQWVEISAPGGSISMLTVKDAFDERHVKSGTGHSPVPLRTGAIWQDRSVQDKEIRPCTSLEI